jgi:hypothetical protein
VARERDVRGRDDFGGGDDLLQGVDPRLQQPRDRPSFGQRDQDRRRAVVEDADLAQQVVLDLVDARRRVDRDRDAAGEQDAEEAEEVIGFGLQHQHDRLAALQAERLETARNLASASQ